MKSLMVALLSTMLMTGACSSGGGGSSSTGPTPDEQDPQTDQQKKTCKDKRKEYVSGVLGDDKTVAALMDKALGDESEQFWQNLPDCYR